MSEKIVKRLNKAFLRISHLEKELESTKTRLPIELNKLSETLLPAISDMKGRIEELEQKVAKLRVSQKRTARKKAAKKRKKMIE